MSELPVSLYGTHIGEIRLAPLYDVSPLALQRPDGQTLALRTNAKWQLPEITGDDVVRDTQSIADHLPGYIRGQAQNLLDGKPARIPSPVPLRALPRIGTPPPTADGFTSGG